MSTFAAPFHALFLPGNNNQLDMIQTSLQICKTATFYITQPHTYHKGIISSASATPTRSRTDSVTRYSPTQVRARAAERAKRPCKTRSRKAEDGTRVLLLPQYRGKATTTTIKAVSCCLFPARQRNRKRWHDWPNCCDQMRFSKCLNDQIRMRQRRCTEW